MQIKRVLIFDFDGTIADSLEEGLKILNNFAPEFGYVPLSKKDFQRLRGMRPAEIIKEFKFNKIKVLLIGAKVLKALRGVIQTVQPFPGIESVLRDFKKEDIQLGMISSNSRENVEAFLEHYELEIFDFIECGTSLFGKDKVINRLISKNKLDRNSITYIGDEVRDIEAAKRAKIKVAAVTWGFNTKELLRGYNPDFLIDTPSELWKFLADKDI